MRFEVLLLSVEACIDEHRRSDAEYYDGPTDVDHGEGTEVTATKAN